MAFFLTRLNVSNYESWKPMFDQDEPGARKDAKGYRIFRSLEKSGEVFLLVEFGSAEAAQVGRERLLSSGVLDRFADKTEPIVIEEADSVGYA